MSRRARQIMLFAACVAGLALAGCGQTDNDTRSATAGLPDLEQSLMAHAWRLESGSGSTDLPGENPVTLVVESSTAASGTAPCNTYRTEVTLDGDDGVSFGPPAATLMGCESAVSAAESAYFEALTKVRSADVTDRDRLVLEGDGVTLSFSAHDVTDSSDGS